MAWGVPSQSQGRAAASNKDQVKCKRQSCPGASPSTPPTKKKSALQELIERLQGIAAQPHRLQPAQSSKVQGGAGHLLSWGSCGPKAHTCLHHPDHQRPPRRVLLLPGTAAAAAAWGSLGSRCWWQPQHVSNKVPVRVGCPRGWDRWGTALPRSLNPCLPCQVGEGVCCLGSSRLGHLHQGRTTQEDQEVADSPQGPCSLAPQAGVVRRRC